MIPSPELMPRRPRGLTLMELVVLTSLVAVGTSVFMEFLMRHADLLDYSTHQADLRTHAQMAVEEMLKELRHATRVGAGSPPNASIPAPPGNTQIAFSLPADLDGNGMIVDALGAVEWDVANPIRYQYVAASRQLTRVAGATSRVLAQDVASVTFQDQTMDGSLGANEVRAQVTLQRTSRGRTITAASSGIVQLRN